MTTRHTNVSDGFVFRSLSGGALRRKPWRVRFWFPATKAAGLDRLTFHDPRHANASLLISVETDIATVSARLRGDCRGTSARVTWFRSAADKERPLAPQGVHFFVGVGGLEPKKARRSKQPGHHTSLTTPNVIRKDLPDALHNETRAISSRHIVWWALGDLNPRPPPCKGGALAN
jgi:hypothetical protein